MVRNDLWLAFIRGIGLLAWSLFTYWTFMINSKWIHTFCPLSLMSDVMKFSCVIRTNLWNTSWHYHARISKKKKRYFKDSFLLNFCMFGTLVCVACQTWTDDEFRGLSLCIFTQLTYSKHEKRNYAHIVEGSFSGTLMSSQVFLKVLF